MATITVRAKFKCLSLTSFEDGYEVVLEAVYGDCPENAVFFKYTPAANINLRLVAGETAHVFAPGEEYYVDFTPCEKE